MQAISPLVSANRPKPLVRLRQKLFTINAYVLIVAHSYLAGSLAARIEFYPIGCWFKRASNNGVEHRLAGSLAARIEFYPIGCWFKRASNNGVEHRCSSKQIFGGAKDFCPNFPKLARKVFVRLMPANFIPKIS